MPQVIQLHVWMQNKKETWTDPEVLVARTDPRDGRKKMFPHVGKRAVLDVENMTIPAMKSAVAELVDSYLQKGLKYYYVVAVVQRDDGEIGYKTIVPKTVVA